MIKELAKSTIHSPFEVKDIYTKGAKCVRLKVPPQWQVTIQFSAFFFSWEKKTKKQMPGIKQVLRGRLHLWWGGRKKRKKKHPCSFSVNSLTIWTYLYPRALGFVVNLLLPTPKRSLAVFHSQVFMIFLYTPGYALRFLHQSIVYTSQRSQHWTRHEVHTARCSHDRQHGKVCDLIKEEEDHSVGKPWWCFHHWICLHRRPRGPFFGNSEQDETNVIEERRAEACCFMKEGVQLHQPCCS